MSNHGNLTLKDTELIGNTADSAGGGLYNAGVASLDGCTISGNSAGNVGAGVENINRGSLSLNDCVIAGNSDGGVAGLSGGPGGGIQNNGLATLTNCEVRDNLNNGGLFNTGPATLTDCTISGNSGGGLINSTSDRLAGTANLNLVNCTIFGNSSNDYGGGLRNSGTSTLTHCTVSGNTAQLDGAGIENTRGYYQLTLTDTIVAGNTVGGVPSDIGIGDTPVLGSYDLVAQVALAG